MKSMYNMRSCSVLFEVGSWNSMSYKDDEIINYFKCSLVDFFLKFSKVAKKVAQFVGD